MKKRLLTGVIIAFVALVLPGAARLGLQPVSHLTTEGIKPENKFRGVSWVAGDSVTLEQLAQLKKYNVTWIAQTPFGWQRAYNEPEVTLYRGNRVYWGERDRGLVHTTRLAK